MVFLHARQLAAAATIACALALASGAGANASTVYRYDGGRVVAHEDPTLPSRLASDPTAGPAPAGSSRAAPLSGAKSAVKGAIADARARHEISADAARRYGQLFSSARRVRSGLTGTARKELSSVLSTLDGIAAAHQLTGSRMPALFLQLRRNTEFWKGGARVPAGARVTFAHSRLVFQYYAGQGLQIQPLANFGKANGLNTACESGTPECDAGALRGLLDELVSIRSRRSGVPTWEYWFRFSTGTPPWTSGMADATAIQALARASVYLRDKGYMELAGRALRVFDRAAPAGVRVRGMAPDSAHYLLYSFASHEWVLNAFAQALNGLYDYFLFSGGDKHALQLFKQGDRSMRREMPKYDTGSWTRYSLGGPEASREYHRLTIRTLRHICKQSGIDFYCRYARRFADYLHNR